MSTDKILAALSGLEPREMAVALKEALLRVLPSLEEEDWKEFLLSLTGEAGPDKVSSLVHL